jgi:hypothetical protein
MTVCNVFSFTYHCLKASRTLVQENTFLRKQKNCCPFNDLSKFCSPTVSYSHSIACQVRTYANDTTYSNDYRLIHTLCIGRPLQLHSQRSIVCMQCLARSKPDARPKTDILLLLSTALQPTVRPWLFFSFFIP